MKPWIEPSAAHLAEVERRLRPLWAPSRAVLRGLVSLDVHGSLPDGPALLLANHATLLDPITLPIAARRSIQWMGTETVVTAPVIGPFQRWLGTVPKKRFHSDLRAVYLLKKWAQVGSVVGLFPEGERTWDGTLQPFLPGLAGLIRLLGVPVVTARIHNHYRQWPRWAVHPGRARLRIEIDAPWTPPADLPDADRIAVLRERLTVPHDSHPELPVHRPSIQGLSNLVHACPACGGRLWETRTALCCPCGEVLTVDRDFALTRRDGSVTPLAAAVSAQDAREAARCRDARGVVLQTAPLVVVDHTGPAPHPVAEGCMRLLPDRIEVGDLRIPLSDVLNVNVEFHRAFEIRTRDRYLKATIPTGSAYRWPVAVRALLG
ncbi:MAG: lysophospholipid acyltransferase family protein [Myxococcota bacterium]